MKRVTVKALTLISVVLFVTTVISCACKPSATAKTVKHG